MSEFNDFELWREHLRASILGVNGDSFEATALEVFRFQAVHNKIYSQFIGYLGRRWEDIHSLNEIPFLPISFFKRHEVFSGRIGPGRAFESSGTTGTDTSRHLVQDLALYDALSVRLFEERYGSLNDYHILALLPSYLERNNSSLVYMVQHFMRTSRSDYSGFFLNNFEEMNQRLLEILKVQDGRKILLVGVTFALLDWAESFSGRLREYDVLDRLIIMETGGMKGRRREMLRQEVHDVLTSQLGIEAIHSEYGMTELLSQAYSKGNGVFAARGSLRILTRDITDPLTVGVADQTGGINVIDLGNLDSCAFIETSDLGRINSSDGTFEIVGRLDNSDIRGCNLLYV